MNRDESIKYLEEIISSAEKNSIDSVIVSAEKLSEILNVVKSLQDEVDSTWLILEEMRLSDISNHTDTVSQEIDKFIKQRRKVAKVGEA